MHTPSASRNSIQSGCHAATLNPGALSRLARSVSETHALRNGLAAGEVTLAIGENHYPPSLPLTHPLAEVLTRKAQLQTGLDIRRTRVGWAAARIRGQLRARAPSSSSTTDRSTTSSGSTGQVARDR